MDDADEAVTVGRGWISPLDSGTKSVGSASSRGDRESDMDNEGGNMYVSVCECVYPYPFV